MDTITFLLTLAFGFLAMMVLGTYCGMPEMGPIVAIAVAGGGSPSSQKDEEDPDLPARE